MTAAAQIVVVIHGKPTTTSVLIADLFGRHHRNVIRSIDRLIGQTTPGKVPAMLESAK